VTAVIRDIVARGLCDRRGREYVRLSCGHAVPHGSGRGHGVGARRCGVCEGQLANTVVSFGLFGKLDEGGSDMAKKETGTAKPPKPAKTQTKPGSRTPAWGKNKGIVEK
jgi:hypothetical protein